MKLDQPKIKDALGDSFPGKVIVHQRVQSTQKLAKQADPPVLQAVLAEEQTGGYGKGQRAFYSPSTTGLYLSVLLPNVSVYEMGSAGLFTTGLATAIATILEEYYPGKHLNVKWVNDILFGPAKVCGILVEAQVQGNQVNWIVGIGINLSTTDFPTNIDRVVGSLDQQHLVDRNQLAADVIKMVWQVKQSYQTGRFIPEYQRRLVLMDKQVTLKLANTECTGIVQGIDHQGRLLLKLLNGNLQAFSDGEVVKVQY